MSERIKSYLGIVAILALFPSGVPLSLAAGTGHEASLDLAATDRTLTIYSAECPPEYTGDASNDECDGNPVPGVPFRIGRPNSEAFTNFMSTGDDGLVTFEFDSLARDGTLRVIEELPAETERFVVYCVNEDGEAIDVSYVDYATSRPGIGVVDLAVGSEESVLCDWYNVPRASTATNQRSDSCSPEVQLVGEPASWTIPNAAGYGEADGARLWFGVLIENCSRSDAIGVDVLFRSYKPDGTPYTSCSGWTASNAGKNIAPGEMAWVTCDAGGALRSLSSLQLSARIRASQPEEQAGNVDYEVVAAEFEADEDGSNPMEARYVPSALVSSTLEDRDTLALLLFRFYDEQGVQVGTCESDVVIVEPDIARRVTCSIPPRMDTTSPQPERVAAVPLPCDVKPDSGSVLTSLDRASGCT